MDTRKEQKEKRRQDIIYAALELFVSQGYAATKVTDIAKKVNMSTGLMFHYFDSKKRCMKNWYASVCREHSIR